MITLAVDVTDGVVRVFVRFCMTCVEVKRDIEEICDFFVCFHCNSQVVTFKYFA